MPIAVDAALQTGAYRPGGKIEPAATTADYGGGESTGRTIVSLTRIRRLRTFSQACSYNPVFLRLYAQHLQSFGFHIPIETREGSYQRYTGDTSVPGKGEILVWRPHAS